MTYRTHSEEDERRRREHDPRRERFEYELAVRERIAEYDSVPAEDPAVERLARRVAEPQRAELRAIEGDGITGDPDVPASMAVLALSERTLRGVRREISARLAEVALGGEEGRCLGALSRVVRGELERRGAAASWPRRAA